MKRIDGKMVSAFTLHLHGCDAQGVEQFGEQAGMMLQKKIPAFLVELGKAVEAAGTTYAEWKRDNIEQIKAIAAKYLEE